MGRGNKKRKQSSNPSSGPTLPMEEPPELPPVKFGDFKLTSNCGPTITHTEPKKGGGEQEGTEWEPAKKKQKKAKKEPKGRNYPEMVLSPQKLKSAVKISDIQNLALWLVADGIAPQWLMVRNKPEIRRAVVLMVPGLTLDMFTTPLLHPSAAASAVPVAEDIGEPIHRDDTEVIKSIDPKSPSKGVSKPSPDANMPFWPTELSADKLAPCLSEFPRMFNHVWPIKAAGDERSGRLISPVNSFLNSPLPKGFNPPSNRTSKRIAASSLLMSLKQLIDEQYPLHSSQLAQRRGVNPPSEEEIALLATRAETGWVETDLTPRGTPRENQKGSVTEGFTIYAIDCEMCITAAGAELTRISILDWDGDVVYDTLVKPKLPITDYLTRFSGMTPEKLANVTTTLPDVQAHLKNILNNDTILVGQGLNNDLIAMRYTHPHIIDTSVIYTHPRGPPLKASLKSLASRHLKREIQTGGPSGHDSIEDARACLDLLKMKLERGVDFGNSEAVTECIFKRIERYPVYTKVGAIVDGGTGLERKWPGVARAISANTDDEVVEGIAACVAGDSQNKPAHLVWGRLRALEGVRGWTGTGSVVASTERLTDAVKETAACVKRIWDALPKCTAFIVYSGTGDPMEMRRLLEMQKEFKEQYKTKKWDELTVQWTDVEEQQLKEAVRVARWGIGFMDV
ncbi:hypothetical protein P167DRAFT_531068, partial [Morchella conica CCBAS932]